MSQDLTLQQWALACLAASRWIAGLRRGPAKVPHAAVLPLLGTTAVIIAMMVAGPAIATLLPRNPDIVVDTASLLPGYFAMLVPVCALNSSPERWNGVPLPGEA